MYDKDDGDAIGKRTRTTSMNTRTTRTATTTTTTTSRTTTKLTAALSKTMPTRGSTLDRLRFNPILVHCDTRARHCRSLKRATARLQFAFLPKSAGPKTGPLLAPKPPRIHWTLTVRHPLGPPVSPQISPRTSPTHETHPDALQETKQGNGEIA